VHDQLSAGLVQFLDGLSPPDREHAQSVLLACPTIEVDAGAPRFSTGFPAQALLLVDDGFVILRATVRPASRAVVTCEAGRGRVLLPPTPDELLAALGRPRLTVIDAEARGQLLRIPALAERVVAQLALALGQKREATANFALTRHIDRVSRKLLQLAGSYGHVVREGHPHRLSREPRAARGGTSGNQGKSTRPVRGRPGHICVLTTFLPGPERGRVTIPAST
jgi:hypothetical protein